MAQNLIERLKHSPVLCDGAMGTLLYAKGIFINRCYDELNLSQPELIRAIHHDYLQAGAEIIETNTFGGNSFRLARHSLADRVHDINVAGAQVAREAAKSFDVWVAGSIGPLGIRIEPLGKTSFEEARTAFREQVAALVEGGVDLFMLETFGYVEELHQAVLACRDVDPKIPIIAQVTIDEDGNCLDGSDSESFAARLTEWNVDVLGINCSVGPVAMLDAIERVRAVTSLPLAAQPNAGMPRSVEGTQHLSLFAGIHGQLHKKIRGRRSPTDRRMLRHHARSHPRHEVSPTRARSTRQDRDFGGDSFRSSGQGSGKHSHGRALAPGRKARRRRICHHGRDRAPQGHRHPKGDRGREVRQIGRRRRGSTSPTARAPRRA